MWKKTMAYLGMSAFMIMECMADEVPEEMPDVDPVYLDASVILGMNDEAAAEYIENYFSREMLIRIYGDPYEVEAPEGEWGLEDLGTGVTDAIAGLFGVTEEQNGAVVNDVLEKGVEESAVAMAGALPELMFNTEEYDYYPENSFHTVLTEPCSTFAADVDTGSYGNLRRYIEDGYDLESIPDGLLRYEEILNYFDYTVETVSEGKFSVQTDTGECPWNQSHELLMLTVQANQEDLDHAGNNFVFLMDVSGSMDWNGGIDLASKSFAHLARTLTEQDKVSVVTYSGSEETLLEGCSGSDIRDIFEAIRQAEYNCIFYGGGTNGSGGITAAYDCAAMNYIEGGNNRVIIASDGDMNLGITSEAGLVDLITEKKETGVFLTTLGFGEGNYSDANMERIADCGNGNYYYIDGIEEAIHVLVDKMKQTTLTVAKDVKFQLEFNPVEVEKYKLIGYENRIMSADDFSDDTKDGGEVGAGAQVTVLYELIPAEKETEDTEQTSMKYQTERGLTEQAYSGELASMAIRYKEPKDDISALEEYPVIRSEKSSEEFLFTTHLAEACLVINDSADGGSADFERALIQMKAHVREGDQLRTACVKMLEQLIG